MTQANMERKQEATTIRSITPPVGTEVDWLLETLPIPPSKFPGKFKVGAELVKGLKPGDAVMLTLERGGAKKDNPTKDWDYWWNLVAIEQGTKEVKPPPAPGAETLKPSPGVAKKAPEEIPAKELLIAREVAFKGAVDLVCALLQAEKLIDIKPPELAVGLVVEQLTDKFYLLLVKE